jgi:outer membrane protein
MMVMALSFIICQLSFSPVRAQIFIGCISYDAALRSMPQYTVMEAQMDTLRQAYNEELKRVEADFNQKYEAFLDGRKDFPRTILLKRQTELQQLLERNVEFKEKSLQELEQIRKDKLSPLNARLSMAISAVARRHQLAVVVNTDSNACPFIDPELAIDLNEEVKEELSKVE